MNGIKIFMENHYKLTGSQNNKTIFCIMTTSLEIPLILLTETVMIRGLRNLQPNIINVIIT